MASKKTEPQAEPTRVEAPVTLKAYLMCAFAAFGGIFFGYDSGYINGVLAMDFLVKLMGTHDDTNGWVLPAARHSLIVSMLSLGTFVGAFCSGDLADTLGRRTTVMLSCAVFCVGVVMQTATTSWQLLIVGRVIAGLGVGGVSSTIIMYMSEIAPRKVRGALVSGYQFCITVGLLLAACVTYATKDYNDSRSYRIPIAIQFLWAIILAVGLALLPESPRFHIKRGNVERATSTLARLRGQPADSQYIRQEIAEMRANNEYELQQTPQGGYLAEWKACFHGSLRRPSSNLRRTILGTSLQMMQQWTGVNFVFYFGTRFFTQLGTIHNPFLITLALSLVNVLSTPISFYTIERYGRRPLLIWGAFGMVICQFIVAAVGVTNNNNDAATKTMIVFLAFYIFLFASTWGPGAWVVIGEIFPLPIRARGVGLSTASNWLWNFIIGFITPYMVGTDKGNLGAKVFFLWGSLCFGCFVYAYFLIYETKGLTLEQVDRMMEDTTPMTSAGWVSTTTYAEQIELANNKANADRTISNASTV